MFYIQIKFNTPLQNQEQQKSAIQQTLAAVEVATLKESEGTWIVEFNTLELQVRALTILKKDHSITILQENKDLDDPNDYEIIYHEQDQQVLKESQDNKANLLQIPQNQQEIVIKSNDSLQNLSFNSSDQEENSSEEQKKSSKQEIEQNKGGDNDQQNQQEDQNKIGSSNTIETIQTEENLSEEDQRTGGNPFETTIVQSPLISEEETDDTHQKIFQNISKINTTKEQRNALSSSFNQASQHLKEINRQWVSDEEEKKKDFFNANVLFNSNYQILALGFFTFYLIFL